MMGMWIVKLGSGVHGVLVRRIVVAVKPRVLVPLLWHLQVLVPHARFSRRVQVAMSRIVQTMVAVVAPALSPLMGVVAPTMPIECAHQGSAAVPMAGVAFLNTIVQPSNPTPTGVGTVVMVVTMVVMTTMVMVMVVMMVVMTRAPCLQTKGVAATMVVLVVLRGSAAPCMDGVGRQTTTALLLNLAVVAMGVAMKTQVRSQLQTPHLLQMHRTHLQPRSAQGVGGVALVHAKAPTPCATASLP